MSKLNNLAVTATGGLMSSAIGAAMDTLQALVANGGRDTNCKFYYNDGPGGSLIQVAAKAVVGGVVSELKNEAVNAFNSLLNGKKVKPIANTDWIDSELERQEQEIKEYGKLIVKTTSGKDQAVYALDDWGNICPDALMLSIETDTPVHISQTLASAMSTEKGKSGIAYNDYHVQTTPLVWYDTTALITINSDKNLLITRVTGRDYSRKELISNGDIKFTVSGQITSGRPDIYPTEEMKKFYKVMQYKGIVKINNQMLDQLGITHIVIESFNVSPRQGYKALMPYTFSAIGLQPEKEIEVTEDTVTIVKHNPMAVEEDNSSEWMKMLNNQLEGLKSMASDVFSQGAGLAAGLLNDVL